jgi:hypothetical protein
MVIVKFSVTLFATIRKAWLTEITDLGVMECMTHTRPMNLHWELAAKRSEA